MEDVRSLCLVELRKYLVQPGEFDAVASGKPLLQSSSIDSVTLLSLTLALEERFAIEFDADEVEKVFFDLASICKYIEQKLVKH